MAKETHPCLSCGNVECTCIKDNEIPDLKKLEVNAYHTKDGRWAIYKTFTLKDILTEAEDRLETVPSRRQAFREDLIQAVKTLMEKK